MAGTNDPNVAGFDPTPQWYKSITQGKVTYPRPAGWDATPSIPGVNPAPGGSPMPNGAPDAWGYLAQR